MYISDAFSKLPNELSFDCAMVDASKNVRDLSLILYSLLAFFFNLDNGIRSIIRVPLEVLSFKVLLLLCVMVVVFYLNFDDNIFFLKSVKGNKSSLLAFVQFAFIISAVTGDVVSEGTSVMVSDTIEFLHI